MSIKLMTSAWEVNLPDSEKLVLLALADWANDDGACWPSMAKLATKCSKSDRTVQTAIKALVAGGHLTRIEVVGKGCRYVVHPRINFTPEEASPPKGTTLTPEEISGTPEAASDNTSRIHQEPLPRESGRAKKIAPVLHLIPEGWSPKRFGNDSASQRIIDGWPPGEMEAQLEHFRAHHGKKADKFVDWQQAWSTWVLNTRRFGGSNGRRNETPDIGKTATAANRVLERIAQARGIRP